MRTTIAIGIVGLALFAGPAAAQTPAERARVLSDFRRSVAEYAHQQPGVEPAVESAGTLTSRVFTLPVAMVFRTMIAGALSTAANTPVLSGVGTPHRAAAWHPLPAADLHPFPAVLRAALPALPAPLEYRLIDHDLVIRDAKTGLVVAVLRDAIRSTTTPDVR